MNKNELFEIKITDMGVDGEGIGKYEGMTFFVKDALIGDVILARATKLKKNYGYARVEKILAEVVRYRHFLMRHSYSISRTRCLTI